MDTPPSAEALTQAREAFTEGAAHFEARRLAQAEQCFARALALAPGRPSVLLNLGVVRLHLGRAEDALPCLQAATQALPDDVMAWRALAGACRTLQRWDEACTALQAALRCGPQDPVAMAELAATLARLQRQPEALAWAQRALQAAGADAAPDWWVLQGDLQRELGQGDAARDSYRRARDAGADPVLMDFYLSALENTAATTTPPADYVRALFDDYAADFEQHLVGTLQYQGHETLMRLLAEATPAQRFARVLDAGCGTGLCGRLLRARCDHLTGIDLAPAMVEQAQRTQVYDRLAADDLCTHLLTPGLLPYDLVVAADVFIYVGPLEAVFKALHRATQPGSWLAFTVEAGAPGTGVRLLPSLRYSHSADLLHGLAERHGWTVVRQVSAPIRVHEGTPLPGEYWILQRL